MDRYLDRRRRARALAGRSLFLNVGATERSWTALDVAQTDALVFRTSFHWIKSSRSTAHQQARRQVDPGSRSATTNRSTATARTTARSSPLHAARRRAARSALGVRYRTNRTSDDGVGLQGVRCRGNTWFILNDQRRGLISRTRRRFRRGCRNDLRLHGVSRIGIAMDPFTGLAAAVACAMGIEFIALKLTDLHGAVTHARATGLDAAIGEKRQSRGTEIAPGWLAIGER